MIKNLPKVSPLRKAWDRYLVRWKLKQTDIAYRAGINDAALSRAIRDGIASDAVRDGLRKAGVPEYLIPLPNNPRELAAMIYKQQEMRA